MRKYKEFTIQSADGTVIWTTSLLVTETELKPERSAGEYWRGTYEVKRGDTLSDVAKRYGTRVSTLLELNPSIKDKDEISVGAILRVPPNKQSNDRNSERKNPPKPKQPVDETHGSTQSASPSVNSSQSDQIASNSSASSVQSRAAAPSASQGVSPHTNAQPRQVQQQKTTPNADSQTINKIESSNQDGNSVTTLTPECVCKKYDLIWGAKVSCAFRKKVVEIAKSLWGEGRCKEMANALMAVMNVETAGTFSASKIELKATGRLRKNGSPVRQYMPLSKQEILDKAENFKGVVGLIQFTEIAIKALNQNFNLNLTKRKLALMSPTEQLSYVEHYFKLGDAYKKIQRGDDIYLHVFAPKGVGKPDDYVLYRKNDPKHPEYYSENASVDYDSNSLITNSEILSRLHQSINDGSANDNRSDFKDHEVIEHTYSVVSYEESNVLVKT